jgi:hypothetical protein
MEAFCYRIAVLAHNLLCQCPTTICELLGTFVFAFSGDLKLHEMVLVRTDVPKSFPERFQEIFPGRVFCVEF